MLNEKIKKEALSIAGGLYNMNAVGSTTYAFCHDGKEILMGEFRFVTEEYPPPIDSFDAYVDFDRDTGEYEFHECETIKK